MSRTAQIDVEEIEHGLYDVVVDSFTTARSFRVTLSDELFEYLGAGRTREELIRDAFRFLLEREPKESILEEFDIDDIKKYYP
ncbi:MAG: hypothetical protein AAB482_03785, partial [Patescibacteria group bacterium]